MAVLVEEVQGAGGGLLSRGDDAEGRKPLLEAVIVEEVATGGEDREDVGGEQQGGVGDMFWQKKIRIEAVLVADGANCWSQVRRLPVHGLWTLHLEVLPC